MAGKWSGKTHDASYRRTKLAMFLLGIIVALLMMHILVVIGDMYLPGSILAKLNNMFDLDKEHNIPTYINSLFFIVSALWCVRLAAKVTWIGHKFGWLLFSLAYTYFALDESLLIHEQLAEPLRRLWDIQAGNPFFHAWTIPAIGGLGVIATTILILKRYHSRLVVFNKVLLHIFVLAGGVVSFEVAGTFAFGHPLFYRIVMVSLEECFELTMAALLWLKLRSMYQSAK